MKLNNSWTVCAQGNGIGIIYCNIINSMKYCFPLRSSGRLSVCFGLANWYYKEDSLTTLLIAFWNLRWCLSKEKSKENKLSSFFTDFIGNALIVLLGPISNGSNISCFTRAVLYIILCMCLEVDYYNNNNNISRPQSRIITPHPL